MKRFEALWLCSETQSTLREGQLKEQQQPQQEQQIPFSALALQDLFAPEGLGLWVEVG